MIRQFKGEYGFLSNFAHSPIEVDGFSYPTVEHAFQAYKTLHPDERAQIREAETPAEAKRLGRRVLLRQDWEAMKHRVMRKLIWCKFLQHPDLGEKLMATGDQELIEYNTWHDNHWGSCVCEECKRRGLNHLGKILMEVRATLRDITEPME